MLHGKPKLEAIEGNLRAAAQNELEELDSAKNVRDLLARANAWVQRASAFLSQEGLSSLEDLEVHLPRFTSTLHSLPSSLSPIKPNEHNQKLIPNIAWSPVKRFSVF